MGHTAQDSRVNHKPRVVAHWAGVIIGVVGGLWLFFRFGLRALFTSNGNEPWLLIVAGVVMFSTLPLSVLGIFKPRAAAWGITASVVAFIFGLTILTHQSPEKWTWPVPWAVFILSNLVVLPGAVAALLFYGSRRDTAAVDGGVSKGLSPYLDRLEIGDRRKHAQWAAVAIGLVAGVWRLPSGMFALGKSIGIEDWLGVVGITATSLTLLPLSILAILKPRPAAYALLLSLGAALAYPLVVFPPFRFGWTGTLSGMFFASFLGLPLALVAGLLLYATSFRNKTSQNE